MPDKLISLFFPDHCIVCEQVHRSGAGIHICESCLDKIRFPDELKTCKKCSRPVDGEELYCVNCKTTPHRYLIHLSCALFEGEMRRAILRYKFAGRPQYHITFANMILNRIRNYGMFPRPDLVLFVPLHPDRKKARGYNQSELIAKRVAKGLQCPFDRRILVKTKNTAPQSKVEKEKRRDNIRGAFAVKNKEAVAGKTVLLIDDVYTTGATIDELSKILLKAGAKQVCAATAAITPK